MLPAGALGTTLLLQDSLDSVLQGHLTPLGTVIELLRGSLIAILVSPGVVTITDRTLANLLLGCLDCSPALWP